MTYGMPIRFFLYVRSIVAVTLLAACVSPRVFAEEEEQAEHISTYQGWVTSAAFSPDGSLLATVGGQSLHYRPGDVKLWDTESGSLVASLDGHTSNVWSVAFSSDGTTLVASGYDGKVVVWNVEEKRSTAVLEKHTGWCRSVAFSSDGKQFATAGEDGTVVLWELDGPKQVKELKTHESAVYQVAFSPDGKTLATASTDKTVKLWDWETGKEKASLDGHEDTVWAVAYSKDGSLIATAGADRTIKLWDAHGSLKSTLVGHKDWVTSVAFSPDGKQLAAADYGRTVKLWNVELAIQLGDEVTQTLTQLKQNKEAAEQATQETEAGKTQADALKKKAEAIAAIVDSRLLAEELKEAEAALLRAKDNRFVQKAVEEAKAATEAASKTAEEQSKSFKDDKEFSEKLKKIKEGPLEEARNEHATASKSAAVAAAAVTAAQEKKAGAEKAIGELEQKSRNLSEQQFKTLGDFRSSVWGVTFSPDGKLVATGSHKAVRIWNLAKGKELFPRPEGEEQSSEEE